MHCVWRRCIFISCTQQAGCLSAEPCSRLHTAACLTIKARHARHLGEARVDAHERKHVTWVHLQNMNMMRTLRFPIDGDIRSQDAVHCMHTTGATFDRRASPAVQQRADHHAGSSTGDSGGLITTYETCKPEFDLIGRLVCIKLQQLPECMHYTLHQQHSSRALPLHTSFAPTPRPVLALGLPSAQPLLHLRDWRRCTPALRLRRTAWCVCCVCSDWRVQALQDVNVMAAVCILDASLCAAALEREC